MDILNFISWIRARRLATSVPNDSLIPVGIKDPRRDDKYLTVAVKKSDLFSGDFCPINLDFKEGSVGEKVSFKKAAGADPNIAKDAIIPGFLEITRGNGGGGIYNIAVENSFNNQAPKFTSWNTQYLDPANTSWAPLWDIENRTYDTWRKAIQTPEGTNAPPQYVGMPVIMKYQGIETRYWLVIFTEWGVGEYGEEGAFAYDRWEIFPSVTFKKDDYDDTAVDVISEGVHIKRDDQGPLYNAVTDPFSEVGASPRNTRWNSIYTDARPGCSGFSDLSNIESRVYTDFTLALDYAVGNNVLNTDLIMHDMTTDLYYKVTFSSWTSNNNGGGFEYTRTVIPQSCGIKFADQSVLNSAITSSSSSSLTAEIFISSSEILNIGTSPVTLLPAPGIGKYHNIEQIILEVTDANYTILDDFVFQINKTTFQVSKIAFTDTGNTLIITGRNPQYVQIVGGILVSQIQIPNFAMDLSTTTGNNPVGGSGTARVLIKYTIETYGA